MVLSTTAMTLREFTRVIYVKVGQLQAAANSAANLTIESACRLPRHIGETFAVVICTNIQP